MFSDVTFVLFLINRPHTHPRDSTEADTGRIFIVDYTAGACFYSSAPLPVSRPSPL